MVSTLLTCVCGLEPILLKKQQQQQKLLPTGESTNV